MNENLSAAVAILTQAAADFAAGKLTPIAYRDVREPALSRALVAMAADHGVDLEAPLHIDSNGEYSIIAKNPNGPLLLHGCGKFGAAMAAALTQHMARTGVAPGTIAGDNGWCRLNHMQAEKMVLAYANAPQARSSRPTV